MEKHDVTKWQKLRRKIFRSANNLYKFFITHISQTSTEFITDAEQLRNRIILKVKDKLQNESFPQSHNRVRLPSIIEVYLSKVDYHRWDDQRREMLTEDLNDMMPDLAKKIAGEKVLTNLRFVVNLCLSPTLPTGQIGIQSYFEKDDSFGITLKKEPILKISTKENDEYIDEITDTAQVADEKNNPVIIFPSDDDEDETVVRRSATDEIETFVKVQDETDPDITEIPYREETEFSDMDEHSEHDSLSVELWVAGNLSEKYRVARNWIVIGRNTESREVDVPLDNPKISRKHLLITRRGDNFLLNVIGRLPVMTGGRKIVIGEKLLVLPGDEIQILNYTIKVIES